MQQRRRATILLETMIAIVMLAFVVPATVAWMQDAAADRADAVNSLRASAYATAIAEHIIADAVSTAPALGMDAFTDPTAYLDTPDTGLRARMIATGAAYQMLNFNFDVAIGSLVGPEGVATGDPQLDVIRPITVTVRFAGARGRTLSLAINLLVADTQ